MEGNQPQFRTILQDLREMVDAIFSSIAKSVTVITELEQVHSLAASWE